MSGGTRTELLLVEDDDADATLLREAFSTIDADVRLRVSGDGYDALRCLKRTADDDPAALPDIVIVDLDLPGKDGCELLEAIRAEPRLRRLPVLVFTDSSDPDDVSRCYEAHANAYLTKPTGFEETVTIAELLVRFWCRHAKLPPAPTSR
ncbi:response regulator [Halobiforma nitratireducens]|uniref:Response regulator receiver protein n=1 Tax=Halobiforma nitratireducens JCM 10879 TaxID=1227454 RepID=M0M5Z0_9EURY|nr:response regulator [Halobiforma nitratireducens]EMA40009.1 response regulator receiver protein [Halobiforma nitratireducens JCM 10879]